MHEALESITSTRREALDAYEEAVVKLEKVTQKDQRLQEKIEMQRMELCDIEAQVQERRGEEERENMRVTQATQSLLVRKKALLEAKVQAIRVVQDSWHQQSVRRRKPVRESPTVPIPPPQAPQLLSITPTEATAIRQRRLENETKLRNVTAQCQLLEQVLNGDLHWDHCVPLAEKHRALQNQIAEATAAKEAMLKDLAARGCRERPEKRHTVEL
eukprot:TRINITY_DN16238_c0_g1_i1.p1 TRINITY_DN16238_c0_g1~~TRINITY_DN16238_c0_g1_i1.p1  ORF type:complete len:215 (+),score=53.99 TRINITY_DN16238_c0_g1_i1:114-758(+)